MIISYELTLPLPNNIQMSLARLSFGIPNAKWIEQTELCISIRSLGKLDNNQLVDIKEELTKIKFSSFHAQFKSFSICSVNQLWLDVEKSSEIISLQRKIDLVLQPFPFCRSAIATRPHVLFAFLEQPKSPKVFDYLASNSFFHSNPFLIDCFRVQALHRTSTHIFSQVIATYKVDLAF